VAGFLFGANRKLALGFAKKQKTPFCVSKMGFAW
jgi:hypothetical protein